MATAGDAVRKEQRRRRTPNVGKQIGGGTANFIYHSGEDRPRMPIALRPPQKNRGTGGRREEETGREDGGEEGRRGGAG